MTSIKEALKPCPFCGRDVEIVNIDFDGTGVLRIEVDCRCGVSVSIYSDDCVSDWQGHRYQLGKNAIEKWNARAEQTEPSISTNNAQGSGMIDSNNNTDCAWK